MSRLPYHICGTARSVMPDQASKPVHLVIAFLAAALLAGCSSMRESRTVEQMDKDYAADCITGMIARAETIYGLDTRNSALVAMKTGCLAFDVKDYHDAGRWFSKAYSISFDPNASHAADLLTPVTLESVKDYKGWPYERAMICFYQGLINYHSGNSLAAWAYARQGLAEDMMTQPTEEDQSAIDQGRYLKDFSVFYFMCAKACERIPAKQVMGDKDTVMQTYYDAYARYSSETQTLLGAGTASGEGAVFLVALDGNGPRRARAGFQGSVGRPLNVECEPATFIRIAVDAKPVGTLKYSTDIYQQAEKHYPRGNRIVQYSKATARIVLFSAGIAMFGAPGMIAYFLMPSEGDIRVNDRLPNRIFVVTLAAEPGLHTVTVEFLDNGRRSIGMQTWHGIDFRSNKAEEQLLCVRR